MRHEVVHAVQRSLEEMQSARDELAVGATYYSTTEAVDRSPIELTAESLIDYPQWIVPRVVKKPHARRRTYCWDPRDVRDLPQVLRRWNAAIEEGPDAEEQFKRVRRAELEARDRPALAAKQKEAA